MDYLFLSDINKLPVGACTYIRAAALKPGHTKLTVTYEHGSLHLETFITIASYPELHPVDPEYISVITLGASKIVIFEGGPSSWVLDPSRYHKSCKFYNRLASSYNTLIDIVQLNAQYLIFVAG